VSANARATRIKLLVHDAFGIWWAARRLSVGSFAWPREGTLQGLPLALTREQHHGLPARRCRADRQQPHREPDAALGVGTQ